MDGSDGKPQYTMAGVMFFLQQEARRGEKERSEWAVERALLQTKITYLEGEKIAAQNLNNDLLRRIKMLEFALKQERSKYVGGALAVPKETTPPPTMAAKADPVSFSTPKVQSNGKGGKNQKSRQILQRYLSEMANTDSLIFTKHSPSLQERLAQELPTPYLPLHSLAAQDSLKMQKGEIKLKLDELRAKERAPRKFEETTAEDENSEEYGDGTSTVRPKEDKHDEKPQVQNIFANQKPTEESKESKSPKNRVENGTSETSSNEKESPKEDAPKKESPTTTKKEEPKKKSEQAEEPEAGGDLTEEQLQEMASKYNLSSNKLGRMMKGYEKPKKEKKGSEKSSSKISSFDFAAPEKGGDEAKGKFGGLDELKNLSVVDEQDYKPSAESKDAQLSLPPKQWKSRSTLRGHLDSVRVVAFREHESVLLSASEDGTIKLWNTGALPSSKKQPEPEPFYTFRGHMSMVLSMAVADHKNETPICYSGSADGSIRMWRIPPANLPTYTPFDHTNSGDIIAENQDAVWCLKAHPVRNVLLSVSANGFVKLWSPETKKALLSFEKAEAATPTSVDFVHTDLKKVVVSYANSKAHVFDLETGKAVLALDSAATYDNSLLTQINQIITHPTLPLAITGHEDKYIRFFDLNTGSCTNSMVAHLDAVSCLTVNPNGLGLVSGGHDSSIRCWDINTHACTQEFTSHRRKYNEGVHSLAFHPTTPILASGGADATVRVYV